MARKGGGKHLKRLAAPRHWPIRRKEAAWTVRPRPGSHRLSNSIPLALVVRHFLNLARSSAETRRILSDGLLYVDGKPRRDGSLSVGPMDVVQVPKIQKSYRILPTPRGELGPVAISDKEASFKLCRIESVGTLSRGRRQLHLHDGGTLRLGEEQLDRASKADRGTVVQLSLPDRKAVRYLPVQKRAYALLMGGANIGRHGRIATVEQASAQRVPLVSIQDSEGNILRTVSRHLFVVGEEKPLITLPEVPAS